MFKKKTLKKKRKKKEMGSMSLACGYGGNGIITSEALSQKAMQLPHSSLGTLAFGALHPYTSRKSGVSTL